jgi:hypothetical protein
MKNVYKMLVAKPEGKKPLGRPRRRWEDNIRTDFREIWTEFVWLKVGTSGEFL